MVSSSLYISLVVALAFMLAGVAMSAPAAHKSSARSRLGLYEKRAFARPIIDDVSRCIMACGECAEDLDTPDDKDPEETLSLVCANQCMEDTDALVLFEHLMIKKLLNKNFAKCFLHSMTLKDY